MGVGALIVGVLFSVALVLGGVVAGTLAFARGRRRGRILLVAALLVWGVLAWDFVRPVWIIQGAVPADEFLVLWRTLLTGIAALLSWLAVWFRR